MCLLSCCEPRLASSNDLPFTHFQTRLKNKKRRRTQARNPGLQRYSGCFLIFLAVLYRDPTGRGWRCSWCIDMSAKWLFLAACFQSQPGCSFIHTISLLLTLLRLGVSNSSVVFCVGYYSSRRIPLDSCVCWLAAFVSCGTCYLARVCLPCCIGYGFWMFRVVCVAGSWSLL